MNKINDTIGFTNEQLKYPIVNKKIFIEDTKKLVKIVELVFINIM